MNGCLKNLPIFALTMLTCIFAHAQSNVGELMDQGGKIVTRDAQMALAPFRYQYVWPNRLGEGDLIFKADGTLDGTEDHYSSRTTSPAVGTWTVDEAGKQCVKKTLSAWNTKSDLCWWPYQLGDKFFVSNTNERTGRLSPVKSVTKLQQ